MDVITLLSNGTRTGIGMDSYAYVQFQTDIRIVLVRLAVPVILLLTDVPGVYNNKHCSWVSVSGPRRPRLHLRRTAVIIHTSCLKSTTSSLVQVHYVQIPYHTSILQVQVYTLLVQLQYWVRNTYISTVPYRYTLSTAIFPNWLPVYLNICYA